MNKIEKLLKKLHFDLQIRLRSVMGDIRAARIGAYSVQKIQGSRHLYRIRVGQFRIIFYMDRNDIEIVDVERRNEHTYKNL